jgi:hypothetical protein
MEEMRSFRHLKSPGPPGVHPFLRFATEREDVSEYCLVLVVFSFSV